ncbi:hypothetical protein MASR2M48_07580 [Spirochaetota bacterium]
MRGLCISGYGRVPPLKKAIADHLSLGSHIVRQSIDPQDVHIVSGAQQGIDLVARILLRRGDVAALESPGYRGARDAFVPPVPGSYHCP